jgi:hypothetical protein
VRDDWGARGLAGAVLAGGVVLVILDVTDRGVRRFFEQSALTADLVSGVLVLVFTLLVVDQVMRRRALKARSKAVGAHVAIVLAQGVRTADVTLALEAGTGEREAALDEQRTYMLMLLVAAPVLIEAPQARRFLEDAQSLAGTMAHRLGGRGAAVACVGGAPFDGAHRCGADRRGRAGGRDRHRRGGDERRPLT